MPTCEGCYCNGGCSLQQFGSVAMEQCPCGECIIKIMCSDPCDKYHEYIATTYGGHLGAEIEFIKQV